MADCRVKGQAIGNSPHVKESNTIVDSGFHALESPRIPGTGLQSVELGFWNLIVSGIPYSLSCIPDCKAQDSEFHSQNFAVFGFHTDLPDFPYIRLCNIISITFTCQVGV